MKKKFVIVNFSTALIVLFSILFQSVHSIEHLVDEMSAAHCDHKYAENQSEVSHSHHNPEKCLACEYTFSPYFSIERQSYQVQNLHTLSAYSAHYPKTTPQFFAGSLFALRAPPTV